MKRIAFVHNWFPAGGAERVTIDIAEYLNMVGGYEVYVFATHLSESMLTEKVQKVVHLRSIPSQAIPSRRSAAIEKLLVDEHIDILVQVVKSLPDIEGIKARTGCKVVLACHGEPFWQRHAIVHRRRKGFFRKLLWYLYNKRRFEDGTLAMKLAEGEICKEEFGDYPVFLFDDVLSELDETRRDSLLLFDTDKQVIITTCEAGVVEKIEAQKKIRVENGRYCEV